MLQSFLMFPSKTAHIVSFSIGIFFFLLSIYIAFFVKEANFYTSFALGSWLVLDYIDYKLNNTSILSFFYNHKHRHAFYFFFIISFIFCFIVDYLWGVKILKMWEWINYQPAQFLRMYLIMNASFVLGMYELYRIIKTLLKTRIMEENTVNFKTPYNTKHPLYIATLIIGIIFLTSPLYIQLFNIQYITEYIMILPFISIAFISDSITYLTGGTPILEEFIRFNRLKTASLLLTVLTAFIFTEGLNLFSGEWKYLRMPFYDMQVFTIPIAVLVGWVPLVIGSISMINMIKHIDYIRNNRKP